MKPRLYHYDNLKAILIFLVVFGHVIEPIVKINDTYLSIYRFIFVFHMPAFVFVSGYFARKTNFVDSFSKLIAPLIVFQILYVILNLCLGVKTSSTNFIGFLTVPSQGMWYLLSLFCWLFLLNYIKNIKLVLLCSLVLPLLAGLIPGAHLSFGRTLYFFPFFLLGYYFKSNGISVNGSGKVLFALFFGALLLGCFVSNVSPLILFGSMTFKSIGIPITEGLIERYVAVVLAFLCIVGLLKLVPRGKTFFSDFGARTLQIYLLHFIIVKLMVFSGVYSKLSGLSLAVFLICMTVFTYLVTSLKVWGDAISGITTFCKRTIDSFAVERVLG